MILFLAKNTEHAAATAEKVAATVVAVAVTTEKVIATVVAVTAPGLRILAYSQLPPREWWRSGTILNRCFPSMRYVSKSL